MELLLDRARSFVDPGPAEIRPLTLLVGENSAGKSSFLALLRIAFQIAAGETRPNFNVEPYLLGAFDQIAHFRGGKYGRAKSFEIGLGHAIEGVGRATLVGTFTKSGSQPALTSQRLTIPGASLAVERVGMSPATLQLSVNDWNTTIDGSKEGYFFGRLSDVRFLSVMMAREGSQRQRLGITKANWDDARTAVGRLSRAHDYFQGEGRNAPYAGAPVRTKPSRTYNPVDDRPQPEGGHVPMVLARTKRASGKVPWNRLSTALNAFGKESGLFDSLDVKTFGRTDSDPFQIETRIGGPPRNIIDVGYGVSQVLPIISDLTSGVGSSGRTHLLQQPEVHLHPKAQAALGSFLCAASRRRRSRIVVETHSDHLIDRVRMEIREKNIEHSAVSLLFFERKGAVTTIHPIRLDSTGEITEAPPSYREFFRVETAKLLGF
jgi:hypothetical protein